MQNDREEELKRSSLLCLPRDYDFYSILIPVQGIIKKWRDKYLYAELVKRHPCFSDSCCYDSRLRISRQGIFADVVVMQKFRLAEYLANHAQALRFVGVDGESSHLAYDWIACQGKKRIGV